MVLVSSMSFSHRVYCVGKVKNIFIDLDDNVHVIVGWASDP